MACGLRALPEAEVRAVIVTHGHRSKSYFTPPSSLRARAARQRQSVLPARETTRAKIWVEPFVLSAKALRFWFSRAPRNYSFQIAGVSHSLQCTRFRVSARAQTFEAIFVYQSNHAATLQRHTSSPSKPHTPGRSQRHLHITAIAE